MKNILKFDTSKQGVFFTSDTHFYHHNIIKYCNRPWKSMDEMVEDMIQNWNRVVMPGDVVFHLGDFAFCGSQKLKELTNRLNGDIYLIMGNHDYKMFSSEASKRLFEAVVPQLSIEVDNQKIILNHYPMLTYAGIWRNEPVWQLFGHVHSGPWQKNGKDNPRLKLLWPTQYDVGVDNNEFTPISFFDVSHQIRQQNIDWNRPMSRLGRWLKSKIGIW